MLRFWAGPRITPKHGPGRLKRWAAARWESPATLRARPALQQTLDDSAGALRPSRHSGERGGGEFGHAIFRDHGSGMAPHSGYRPDQRFSGLPGIRQGDGGCRARRVDHQYLFGFLGTSAFEGIHIRGGQGGRQSDHAVPGARTGAAQYPGERDSARVLPSGAKPQTAHRGAGGQHSWDIRRCAASERVANW